MQTIVRGDTWEQNIQLVMEGQYAIKSTTGANPIALETVEATPAVTGDWWNVSGHTGNTGVAENNGNFQITKVDPYNMTLDNSEGNGAGGLQGYIRPCADGSGVDIEDDVLGLVKTYAANPVSVATFTKEWIQQIAGLLKVSLSEEDTLAVPIGTYSASVVVTFPNNVTTVWTDTLTFVDAPTTPIVEE